MAGKIQKVLEELKKKKSKASRKQAIALSGAKGSTETKASMKSIVDKMRYS